MSKIIFVVRRVNEHSTFMFKTSVDTHGFSSYPTDKTRYEVVMRYGARLKNKKN